MQFTVTAERDPLRSCAVARIDVDLGAVLRIATRVVNAFGPGTPHRACRRTDLPTEADRACGRVLQGQFDLVVPLRDEVNVIADTLHGLMRQTSGPRPDHPGDLAHGRRGTGQCCRCHVLSVCPPATASRKYVSQT